MLGGHIWKRTVEKSETNETSVTFVQTILGNIWNYTVMKGKTSAISVTAYLRLNFMKTHNQMFKIDINQM